MKDVFVEINKILGSKSEFNLFYNIYREIIPSKFAVVKVSGEVLEKNLDTFARNMAYLNKLDIYPIIIHGAGSKLDQVLPESKKINGYRYTEKEDMIAISTVLSKISEKLEKKIVYYGGKAKRVLDIFECEKNITYGEVGIIKKIHIKKIENTILNKNSPIISPIGKNEDDLLNINADTVAKEITKILRPYKVILITSTGGVLDEQGKIIPFINPEEIKSYKMISGGMLLKLNEMKELLSGNNDLSIAITSCDNILKEIFTIKGSGTFIKSYLIKSAKNFKEINKLKIKELLEKSFNKILEQKYFESNVIDIMYEENYEGVAIIKEINGIPYLDKFVTSKHRQGAGLGSYIWKKVTSKYNKLAWRAVSNNPINNFYYNKCSGCIKMSQWNIYWLNLDEDEVIDHVKYIKNIPTSFYVN